MFYWGSKSTWSCYTHQVKDVHTPSQALAWVIRQSRGGWQEEIAGVVKNTFQSTEALEDIGLGWSGCGSDVEQHQTLAGTFGEFSLRIICNRSWSGMAYEAPPDSYSGSFSTTPGVKQQIAETIRADSKLLWELENIRHQAPFLELSRVKNITTMKTTNRIIFKN